MGLPTLQLLGELQLAHLIRVPFENLHAFHRRGVRTDIDWSYPKIVDSARGGWCFELNGLQVVAGARAAIPRRARIDMHEQGFTLTELMPGNDGVSAWEPQLRVGFEPKQNSDFERRSTYLQTEPGLSWTERAFATRALDADGSRVTLRMDVLRERDGVDEYRESPVAPSEWSELLLRYFGLVDGNVR